MGSSIQVQTRIASELYSELASYCEENGLTMSDAVRRCIEHELGGRPAANDRERPGAPAAPDIDELNRKMELARKNAAKASQAAYGCLSLLSWWYHEWMHTTMLGADEEFAHSPMGIRMAHLAESSITDIFALYSASGGMLTRDSSAGNYFRSFSPAQRLERFEGCSTEEVFGADEESWRELTAQVNEAAAIRNKGKKSRKRKGKDGKGNGQDLGG